MFATRSTIINWMKMTEVRNCSKIIDGVECPCADKLRRLYLTKPRHNLSEIRIKQRIENAEKDYQKCYKD